jgi:hypothetical protein
MKGVNQLVKLIRVLENDGHDCILVQISIRVAIFYFVGICGIRCPMSGVGYRENEIVRRGKYANLKAI